MLFALRCTLVVRSNGRHEALWLPNSSEHREGDGKQILKGDLYQDQIGHDEYDQIA